MVYALILAVVSICIESYCLLDFWLFKKTKLRMQFSFLKHAFKINSLLDSALALGLKTYLLGVACVIFYNAYFFDSPLFLAIPCFVSLLFLLRKKNPPIKMNSKNATTDASSERLSYPKNRPHIIFLVLESFRAKNINETLTPEFLKLMQEGTYFSNFYANSTQTNRALISLLCGTPPPFNTSIQGYAPKISIPQILKSQNYHAVFMHGGDLRFDGLNDLLKNMHFDTLVGRHEILDQIPHALGTSWGVHDECLMSYALNFLEKKSSPIFLTLFTLSNHHPWKAPPHYPPKETTLERYHQTVQYTDKVLGDFIRQLKNQNCEIYITADHGYPMGEHEDNFFPQHFLYDENVRIPLLILGENIMPRVISEVVSQADLLSLVFDQKLSSDSAFLNSPFGEGYLGYRKGDFKYLYTFKTEKRELYNLVDDPEEKHDLAPSPLTDALHDEMLENTISEYYKVRHSKKLNLEGSLKIPFLDSALEELNVSRCLLLTPHDLQTVLINCPKLKKLQALSLEGFPILNSSLALTYLDIRDTFLTDEVFEKIGEFCPHLETLCFNAEKLSDLSLMKLSKKIKRLQVLKIQRAHNFSEEALQTLCLANPNIEYLSIVGGQNLTDKFLSALKDHHLIWKEIEK